MALLPHNTDQELVKRFLIRCSSMMTCFQILPPFLILFCLGRILPSKLSIVPFVHKGIAITPTIINNSLKFTYSERIVDSVMILLVLHFSIPIHLILHRGFNVNLPMLIENYMPLRGCCCSVDSNTKLLFFTQTPCIFFFSPRRWLRGLQSTPPRLPSALFGC